MAHNFSISVANPGMDFQLRFSKHSTVEIGHFVQLQSSEIVEYRFVMDEHKSGEIFHDSWRLFMMITWGGWF